MSCEEISELVPPLSLLEEASLFLDFDGTFVPIADRPDEVRVDTGRRVLLTRLKQLMGGRIAIISGRPVAELSGLIQIPLTIAGSHGVELSWEDGRTETPPPPASLAFIAEKMRMLAAAYPGVLIEEKPFGVAVHYRKCPVAEAACRSLVESLSRRSGMSLQAGKMVFEIRYGDQDKGDAIKAFMRDALMVGTRPIFLGDDLTDESGFRAAANLGGAGILIGSARPTAAKFRLETAADALAWLESAAEQKS